jgi:hypothetical protein
MSYPTYKSYFQNLATQYIPLNGSFVHGPTWRIIGQQRDDIVYPVLYLEWPDASIVEEGAKNLVYSANCAFSILKHTPNNSESEQDIIMDETEEMIIDMISRIWRDRKKLQFLGMINRFDLQPVFSKMADNMYGWRCELQFKEQNPILVDINKWSDLTP